MDFVRLLAAGELAKNPGYDLAAVARLTGFASAAKLSAAVMRLVARPGHRADARLRSTDLLERFLRG